MAPFHFDFSSKVFGPKKFSGLKDLGKHSGNALNPFESFYLTSTKTSVGSPTEMLAFHLL